MYKTYQVAYLYGPGGPSLSLELALGYQLTKGKVTRLHAAILLVVARHRGELTTAHKRCHLKPYMPAEMVKL